MSWLLDECGVWCVLKQCVVCVCDMCGIKLCLNMWCGVLDVNMVCMVVVYLW